MTLYVEADLGRNISQIIGDLDAQFESVRTLERGSDEPTVLIEGLVWNRTDYPALDDAWVRYDGAAFQLLMDPAFAQVNAGGTIAWAANQPLGGFVFTDMGVGVNATDSVRFDQVVLADGSNPFTADIPAGGFKITGLGAPVDDNDAARLVDVANAGKVLRINDVIWQDESDQAATYNPTDFQVDRVIVKFYCSVKQQGGGFTVYNLMFEETIEFNRWVDDATGGFNNAEIEQVVADGIRVRCEFKTSAPFGFYIRLRDDSSGEWSRPWKHGDSSNANYVIQALAFGYTSA